MVDEAVIAARFWAKVDVSAGPSGCWLWTAARNDLGYGRFTVRPRQMDAHRWAWLLTTGSLPAKGLELDHLCRNPPCVNPAHLEPVTHRENQIRGHGVSGRARWTHCTNGHEYTPENTARHHGRRECRTCVRAYRKARNYFRPVKAA